MEATATVIFGAIEAGAYASGVGIAEGDEAGGTVRGLSRLPVCLVVSLLILHRRRVLS